MGLDTVYPELDLHAYLNDAGKADYAAVESGNLDEIIPLAVGAGLRERWCARGATVKRAVYPFGEHLVAQALAEGDAVSWLADRLAGKAAPCDCGR